MCYGCVIYSKTKGPQSEALPAVGGEALDEREHDQDQGEHELEVKLAQGAKTEEDQQRLESEHLKVECIGDQLWFDPNECKKFALQKIKDLASSNQQREFKAIQIEYVPEEYAQQARANSMEGNVTKIIRNETGGVLALNKISTDYGRLIKKSAWIMGSKLERCLRILKDMSKYYWSCESITIEPIPQKPGSSKDAQASAETTTPGESADEPTQDGRPHFVYSYVSFYHDDTDSTKTEDPTLPKTVTENPTDDTDSTKTENTTPPETVTDNHTAVRNLMTLFDDPILTNKEGYLIDHEATFPLRARSLATTTYTNLQACIQAAVSDTMQHDLSEDESGSNTVIYVLEIPVADSSSNPQLNSILLDGGSQKHTTIDNHKTLMQMQMDAESFFQALRSLRLRYNPSSFLIKYDSTGDGANDVRSDNNDALALWPTEAELKQARVTHCLQVPPELMELMMAKPCTDDQQHITTPPSDDFVAQQTTLRQHHSSTSIGMASATVTASAQTSTTSPPISSDGSITESVHAIETPILSDTGEETAIPNDKAYFYVWFISADGIEIDHDIFEALQGWPSTADKKTDDENFTGFQKKFRGLVAKEISTELSDLRTCCRQVQLNAALFSNISFGDNSVPYMYVFEVPNHNCIISEEDPAKPKHIAVLEVLWKLRWDILACFKLQVSEDNHEVSNDQSLAIKLTEARNSTYSTKVLQLSPRDLNPTKPKEKHSVARGTAPSPKQAAVCTATSSTPTLPRIGSTSTSATLDPPATILSASGIGGNASTPNLHALPPATHPSACTIRKPNTEPAISVTQPPSPPQAQTALAVQISQASASTFFTLTPPAPPTRLRPVPPPPRLPPAPPPPRLPPGEQPTTAPPDAALQPSKSV